MTGLISDKTVRWFCFCWATAVAGFFVVPNLMNASNAPLPAVNVSVYWVPETDACKPDGYPEYQDLDSESTDRHCEKLTVEDVHDLGATAISQRHKVPPNEYSLGDELLTLLAGYQVSMNPEERRSVIFVFEWFGFQTANVTFSRRKLARGEPEIPAKRVEGVLENEKRWIYHERADTLKPSYRIQWTLKSEGGDEWTFFVGP